MDVMLTAKTARYSGDPQYVYYLGMLRPCSPPSLEKSYFPQIIVRARLVTVTSPRKCSNEHSTNSISLKKKGIFCA